MLSIPHPNPNNMRRKMENHIQPGQHVNLQNQNGQNQNHRGAQNKKVNRNKKPNRQALVLGNFQNQADENLNLNDSQEEENDSDEDEDYLNGNKNSGEYDDYENELVDALNNTKRAQVDMIFFNRVPKVGSQSLMELMIRLGKNNGFVHARDKGKAHETIFLKPPQQKQLIQELYAKPMPQAYSQHIAYINFTQFRMPRPIYINLVRDPIERIRSWHYYVRAEWYYRDLKAKLGDKAPKMPPASFMQMDLDTCVQTGHLHCQFNQMEVKNPAGDHRRQTLFFCGQNRKLCMPFNSKAAMQKAKRTVEEDYAVVGTWEETNITLAVLEHYVPKFFTDATQVYYDGKDRLSRVNKNNVTRPISEETRMILRRNLTHEIEFYEFCKQRLYLQYSAISEDLAENNDDYALIPDSEEYEDDDIDDVVADESDDGAMGSDVGVDSDGENKKNLKETEQHVDDGVEDSDDKLN